MVQQFHFKTHKILISMENTPHNNENLYTLQQFNLIIVIERAEDEMTQKQTHTKTSHKSVCKERGEKNEHTKSDAL